MDLKDHVSNNYFEWMSAMVCGEQYSKAISYRKLLMTLHNIPFTYSIPDDENRAIRGRYLRYRFCATNNCRELECYLDGPCSVLEMILALAIQCEQDLMDDASYGDRTSQWFWGMIVNLGLGSMIDNRFDRQYVEQAIDIFLRREYAPDGRGGLFSIPGCRTDLRTVPIWYQLNWYLDTIS